MIISQCEDFPFNGRNRRPPKDKVNALLSFVYTLLNHEVQSALETVGLDPYVGFLHTDRPGRASLALDMMEFFRQNIVDSFVIKLVNKKMVKVEDFYMDEEKGIRMTPDCYRKFLKTYEEYMTKNNSKGSFSNTYRKRIRHEIQGLKNDLQKKSQWHSLPLPW